MHTCQPVLCQSLTLGEAATASFIPHPSFSALSLPLSLPHPLYLACWLRYFHEHRLGADLRRDAELGVPKWLLSLGTRAGAPALPPGRCSFISRHSRVMDGEPVGDGRGIWVSGRFSWLMCLWTRRNGLHHQHSCVWWAADRLGEEL